MLSHPLKSRADRGGHSVRHMLFTAKENRYRFDILPRLLNRLDLVSDSLVQKSAPVVSYFVSIILVYFLFLYFFNPSIFYNPIGFIDAYIYVGYGLYYSIPDFGDAYYKVSRLPWDLAEFAARHILRPDIAAFALQFFSFSLMAVSVFFYFRRLISRSNALLLGTFSIFFALFYDVGGADYHDTISAPLYFLTLALVVAAIANPSRVFAGYSGAAAAAALHTNPMLVLLLPAVILHSIAMCRKDKLPASFIWTGIGSCFLGVVCATIGLGAVAAAFGRTFFFFEPQLEYVLWIQKTEHNVWWLQFSWDWLESSQTNAYLLGVFVICLVQLGAIVARRRTRALQEQIAGYAGYVFVYLLAVAYQFSGQTILQPDKCSYVLVAATFTPLGYLLEGYLRPLTGRTLAFWSAAFPLACALALIGSERIYAGLSLSNVAPFAVVIAAVGGAYFGLVALSWTRSNLAIVLLPILNIALIPDRTAYVYDSCRIESHLNVFMSEASTLASKIAGDPRLVYAFADPSETIADPCFRNIPASHLEISFVSIGHKYLGEGYGEQQLDKLTHDDFATVISDDGIIALLVVQDAVKDRFVAAAAREGIDLSLAGLLPEPISGVKMYFFKLRTL
jgi:hypothetical protein